MKHLFFLLLFLLSDTIFGQTFDQFKYHAIYIPSNYLKNISIDGLINDWTWVPDYYRLKNKDFINGENLSVNDYSIETFVAWSDITNKVYIISKVIDNKIVPSKIGNDDAIRMNYYDGVTIIVNSNLESGQFWSGGNNYKRLFHNIISLPITPIYDPDNIDLFYGTNWLQNKAYINYRSSIAKNRNNTSSVYYEIELSIWEYLSFFSNRLSKLKVLKSGFSVGLTIAFNDVDNENYYNTIKIRTFSGIEFESHAEETSCFILDPPMKSMSLRDDILLLNK